MYDKDVKIVEHYSTPDMLTESAEKLVVRVKRKLSHKTYDGEIIYEVEGETMNRFHRPYKYITQRRARDLEVII